MSLVQRWKAVLKNRAIRNGSWLSNQYENYESAMSNALALVDAIRGKEIDKKYRDGWDDDIVGNGSQNHPLLGAACEFWYQYHKGNKAKLDAVLAAWDKYSRLHFMTGESFSSFIYGLWIIGSILTVAFGARLLGRIDISDRLYAIVRTGYALWALGCSGDGWTGSYPGKSVAWAGSRAWITKKGDDDNYYDGNGVLKQPYNIDHTFATNFLASALGWAAPAKWIKELVDAMKTVSPAEPWGLSESDKERLRIVALQRNPLADRASFDVVVSWLTVTPAISCRIIKTSEWVGFFALNSIHPHSTSFLYARIVFHDRRPTGEWWDKIWLGVDKRFGWINFDPSVRKAGVHGSLEVEDSGTSYIFSGDREQAKVYSGTGESWDSSFATIQEAVDAGGGYVDADAAPLATIPPDTYYYELDGGHRDPDSYRPGPRVVELAYSQKVYDVEFGPGGADVRWPEPGNGNGNGGGDDCSEGTLLERLWCYIKKWLGL